MVAPVVMRKIVCRQDETNMFVPRYPREMLGETIRSGSEDAAQRLATWLRSEVGRRNKVLVASFAHKDELFVYCFIVAGVTLLWL